MIQHLAEGDRIMARPCVVTITTAHRSAALGWCSTCDGEHVIDVVAFALGRGPWRREVDTRPLQLCGECGASHRGMDDNSRCRRFTPIEMQRHVDAVEKKNGAPQ